MTNSIVRLIKVSQQFDKSLADASVFLNPEAIPATVAAASSDQVECDGSDGRAMHADPV